jgi:hypothetical protein
MKLLFFALAATVAVVQGANDPACTAGYPCYECEPNKDCDKKDECGYGLLCADNYKAELTAAGLDPRKAYCEVPAAWNSELCFNPCNIPGFPIPDGYKCSCYLEEDYIV